MWSYYHNRKLKFRVILDGYLFILSKETCISYSFPWFCGNRHWSLPVFLDGELTWMTYRFLSASSVFFRFILLDWNVYLFLHYISLLCLIIKIYVAHWKLSSFLCWKLRCWMIFSSTQDRISSSILITCR